MERFRSVAPKKKIKKKGLAPARAARGAKTTARNETLEPRHGKMNGCCHCGPPGPASDGRSSATTPSLEPGPGALLRARPGTSPPRKRKKRKSPSPSARVHETTDRRSIIPDRSTINPVDYISRLDYIYVCAYIQTFPFPSLPRQGFCLGMAHSEGGVFLASKARLTLNQADRCLLAAAHPPRGVRSGGAGSALVRQVQQVSSDRCTGLFGRRCRQQCPSHFCARRQTPPEGGRTLRTRP